MEAKKNHKYKKYNDKSTYSRADSAIILYCIVNDLPVEIELRDGEKEVVKLLELTNYAVVIRNLETEKDSIIWKHSIKRINFEGDSQKFIESYRKEIGSLRSKK